MRKVIAELAVSLDGFIEGPYGALDWMSPCREASHVARLLNEFDTIFYGRVAYEKFGIPFCQRRLMSEAHVEFNVAIDNMRKYVFTRSLKHVSGNGMVINKDVFKEVKHIIEEKGKNIWLYGGAEIIQTFIALDLIDEYVLHVHPRVLGSGKPLFHNVTQRLNLKLIRSVTNPSGIVILYYRPENRTIKSYLYDSRSI